MHSEPHQITGSVAVSGSSMSPSIILIFISSMILLSLIKFCESHESLYFILNYVASVSVVVVSNMQRLNSVLFVQSVSVRSLININKFPSVSVSLGISNSLFVL